MSLEGPARGTLEDLMGVCRVSRSPLGQEEAGCICTGGACKALLVGEDRELKVAGGTEGNRAGHAGNSRQGLATQGHEGHLGTSLLSSGQWQATKVFKQEASGSDQLSENFILTPTWGWMEKGQWQCACEALVMTRARDGEGWSRPAVVPAFGPSLSAAWRAAQ